MGDGYTNEQLCRLISEGKAWAKDRLILQNLGFVYTCADEIHKAHKAGLEKCGLRGRAYLMYRFGFDDGQKHSEAETARRYHLKRSWARRLEGESLEILKNHLIACGEYHEDTKKELTEAV